MTTAGTSTLPFNVCVCVGMGRRFRPHVIIHEITPQDSARQMLIFEL